ncbi:hypothetical protein AADZ90_007085 [Aestuariibius sp. 2305UL40-4]|uniref:hypothetical protein n=1 Tax=Aestuariibius violaceus TaxID=3234132 RepID=UPI00345EBD2F
MSQFASGYAFALFTALVVIVGDYVLKLAADGRLPLTSTHVIAGCALYAGSAILWYFAMRHVTLAQAGVAYSMLTLIALALIGALVFEEPIGPREGIGLTFALLAMVAMSHTA